MRFVQLLLTDDQAELAAAALRDAELTLKEEVGKHKDETGDDFPEVAEDLAQLGRLSMLFQDASENPSKYPPTGKMAVTVRSIVRRSRGQAETPTRSKRRSGRHQRRRAERHIFRRNREFIENFNRGQEMYEADRLEAEAAAAEIAKKVEGMPTYAVTDGQGNVLMSGIPALFVLDEDGKSLAAPKLITP